MRRTHAAARAVLLAAVVASLGLASPAESRQVATVGARVTRQLERSHYLVTGGYAKLWTQADCDRYTYPIMGTCYGNNPASPYIMPVMKSWPHEFVDPAMVNAFGKTRRGYSVLYRLDPSEAIVIYGTMPPPARYMGLESWVFTKEWLTDDLPWTPDAYAAIQARAPALVNYLFSTVPGNPSRVQSFSTIGNNINNVVIQRQSGAAFGRTRYFIITPDRGMDRAVRRALARVGVRARSIFTEPVPPSHPLGDGPEADDFLTALRYAVPDDPAAADAWRRDLPLTVLRVRERTSSHRVPQPFPRFVPEPRSVTPEAAYAPDLGNLVGQLCARWGQPCDPANPDGGHLRPLTDLQNDLGDFGPDCRAIGMNCLGDGQDASYFLAPGNPLEPNWIYAVVGTLATETGNATYVGLSLNDLSKLKGVVNIPDTDLAGSAAAYAGTVANTDKFFIHYFARDCAAVASLTDGRCTTVTTAMVPELGTEPRGLFSAAVRAYVRPGTQRGPLSSGQLRPMLVRLTAP